MFRSEKNCRGFWPCGVYYRVERNREATDMDDKQLMAQIAAGDQAALQTLLRRHGPLLQYILKPILTDPREREECLADISLRLW